MEIGLLYSPASIITFAPSSFFDNQQIFLQSLEQLFFVNYFTKVSPSNIHKIDLSIIN